MDTILTNQLIMGPLRTLIPTIMAYVIAKGWLPAWFPVSDFDAFLLAMLAAVWSRNVHKETVAQTTQPSSTLTGA